MRFNLKKPCDNCPFRIDRPGYLTAARAREIIEALLADDWSWFGCHKTTEEIEGEDGWSDRQCVDSTQQCAGSLILLLKHGQPNVATHMAVAMGLLDLDTLDMTAPVAGSTEAFIEHHAAIWRRERRD